MKKIYLFINTHNEDDQAKVLVDLLENFDLTPDAITASVKTRNGRCFTIVFPVDPKDFINNELIFNHSETKIN